MKAYITGIGIYSSLGSNVSEVSAAIKEGRSSIVSDDSLITAGFMNPMCAPVQEPRADMLPIGRKSNALLTQAGRYAYVAAKEALEMAGQDDLLSSYSDRNIGIIVSNDLCVQSVVDVAGTMADKCNTDSLSVYDAVRSLSSNVAIALTKVFQIKGLALTINAACSGSLHAVAMADRLVRSGMLDGCLVVGCQETGPMSWCAIDKLDAGIVPSGGAAAIYVESEIRYKGRRGGLLAELDGYGTSVSNAPYTPKVFAEQESIERAFESCHMVSKSDISLINAHLTGTAVGDEVEMNALHNVFQHMEIPPLIANKKYHGHELSMSGISQIVETIACYDAVNVLIDSFGFGGNNAAMILRVY